MLEEMVAEANRRSEAYEAALEEAKQVQAELARKQELEARIEKRADILASLNAQPDWFNYVAAFAASCVSTLVMHPLDTLKTREVAATLKDTSTIAPPDDLTVGPGAGQP